MRNQFKKNPLRWLSLAGILALILVFSSYKESDKNQTVQGLMIKALELGHYNPQKVDNNFSEKVFSLYLKRLDYNKKFLLQSDVDELKKYYDQLDDEVNDNSYVFYSFANDRLDTRMKEAEGYYKDILSKPFDFTKDETVETDAEKLSFAKSQDALKEEWRKYLKYQVMTRVADAMADQNTAKEKNDTSFKMRTPEQMEQDARTKVGKSMDDWFRRLTHLTSNDRFASYLNTIANTYDPHTEYFAPKEKENFDIALSGQLEGIGAQLQQKDGYIKVTHIVPGSASARQGQLKAGDVILKVAQGKDEPVDIMDMELDDAVQLIRGKKGTEVRLTVKKPDGSIITIPIVRDVVVLEDTYAQSSIVNEKNKKIGYIKLPSFYADFNGNGGRNCSDDIRKELVKLKGENVDGVILDLRNNGGGSLNDVVKMVGLFMDKGPVVQVKDREGNAKVLNDYDAGAVYDGPLVVMINSLSASASEIFAAAIQDYKRGVIVGSNSYGKGTVQNIYDLDQFMPGSEFRPLGSIKLTIEKFYRINGDATQLKGVAPDIELPDPYSYLDIYEKDQDYPMPFDKINQADYKTFAGYNIPSLKKHSQERVSSNEGFKAVKAETERLKTQRQNSVVSLNLQKYMADQKSVREAGKQYEAAQKAQPKLDVTSLQADKSWIQADSSRTARIKDMQDDLKKDIYLHEASDVLAEMK